MSGILCPNCGTMIDAAGPAVSSSRSEYDPKHGPTGSWISCWVPFVTDMRSGGQRLIHAECFVDEQGVEALIAIVTASDRSWRESAKSTDAS
jgi:hypothetical protein